MLWLRPTLPGMPGGPIVPGNPEEDGGMNKNMLEVISY